MFTGRFLLLSWHSLSIGIAMSIDWYIRFNPMHTTDALSTEFTENTLPLPKLCHPTLNSNQFTNQPLQNAQQLIRNFAFTLFHNTNRKW